MCFWLDKSFKSGKTVLKILIEFNGVNDDKTVDARRTKHLPELSGLHYKHFFRPRGRVARFLLIHDTRTGKNVPNEHKMY
jgi:hypothetical protein